MYKNIYFNKDTWELFETLRIRTGLSRGDFIYRILLAYISAEGGHNDAAH